MIQIKIIDVPPGQAPDWVRKEWVGLIMPVAENLPPIISACGVLGGKVENPNGYPIETSIAIEALTKKSPEAAQWWKDNVSLNCISWLVFHQKVCQLV